MLPDNGTLSTRFWGRLGFGIGVVFLVVSGFNPLSVYLGNNVGVDFA